MTLNGISAAILHYFTEFSSFGVIYVNVVEIRYVTVCGRNVAQRIYSTIYDLW